MKVLYFKTNVCYGVINPYNSQITIQKKCPTCEHDRFNIRLSVVNIEIGHRVLESECSYCGQLERFNYKKDRFQLANGDEM